MPGQWLVCVHCNVGLLGQLNNNNIQTCRPFPPFSPPPPLSLSLSLSPSRIFHCDLFYRYSWIVCVGILQQLPIYHTHFFPHFFCLFFVFVSTCIVYRWKVPFQVSLFSLVPCPHPHHIIQYFASKIDISSLMTV